MSKYLQDITCNSTFSTNSAKKNNKIFSALFSIFTNTMDYYTASIACESINTFSPNIGKKNGIIKTANILFTNIIVKNVQCIINTTYNALINKTSKAYKAISINFTEFIDNIDLYNIYITAINNFDILVSNLRKSNKIINVNFSSSILNNNKITKSVMASCLFVTSALKSIYKSITTNFTEFIGHVWGQGNWGEFDWANRYIIKKVSKNLNANVDILVTNAKSAKSIINTSYNVLTIKTKKAYKSLTINFAELMDTMDLYYVCMEIANNIDMLVSNSKKSSKNIIASANFTVNKAIKLFLIFVSNFKTIISIKNKITKYLTANVVFNVGITKYIHRLINIINSYLANKNSKIKHYTKTYINANIVNTKKLSTAKTTLIKFTQTIFTKIPRFKFYKDIIKFEFFVGDTMEEFEKQPSEIFEISNNFNSVLTTSETISSYTVKAYDYKGFIADVEDNTVIDSIRNTTTSVYAKVKDGTNGNNYKITTKITTNLGNKYENDVLMRVIDI